MHILDSNQTMPNLFQNIRNAFAHGSFLVRKHRVDKEFYYFLESRNPENELINARLVLKASTLTKWIKVVKKVLKEQRSFLSGNSGTALSFAFFSWLRTERLIQYHRSSSEVYK